MSRGGAFVAFEGGDASGKSTQAARLAERLGAVLTREPGGTAVGRRIRDLLLDPATTLADRSEALLLAADRAQHVHEVIRPALASGRPVVTDRYVASSLAYQAYGRGLPAADVAYLSRWATGDLLPDLVVLLEVPADVAAGRLGALADASRDRFEAEDAAFHDRVAAGFRALAAADPGRWAVVDGEGTIEDVAGRVWATVERSGILAP